MPARDVATAGPEQGPEDLKNFFSCEREHLVTDRMGQRLLFLLTLKKRSPHASRQPRGWRHFGCPEALHLIPLEFAVRVPHLLHHPLDKFQVLPLQDLASVQEFAHATLSLGPQMYSLFTSSLFAVLTGLSYHDDDRPRHVLRKVG